MARGLLSWLKMKLVPLALLRVEGLAEVAAEREGEAGAALGVEGPLVGEASFFGLAGDFVGEPGALREGLVCRVFRGVGLMREGEEERADFERVPIRV